VGFVGQPPGFVLRVQVIWKSSNLASNIATMADKERSRRGFD
jgi:hypothetical protein